MPGLKAPALVISDFQSATLKKIIRRETCPQRDLRRAKIILEASSGLGNQQIADKLDIDRNTVRLWRSRWLACGELLDTVEEEEDEAALESLIWIILADEPRPGGPATFTSHEICQIIALACEKPEESGKPVTHWTPSELAKEAVDRGIVESISARSVGRFLKRSRPQTPSKPILVEQ